MQLRRTPRTSRGLAGRLQQLAEGAELSRGRVDDALLLRAEQVVDRAEGRLAASGDFTVAALAGATGSGKSSLFNALVGQPLTTTGVRRPTTSEAFAVTWGEDPPTDLLDWLDVRRRHSLPADPARDHLVLLDLPDHDSTEIEHRIEAHRLVQLVDLMVWVVDPQKYADAALHDQFLAPMAEHRDVMLVVLNQVDRLTRGEADACQRDLERLLERDGLAGVPVLSLSAVTGLGVPRLQKAIAQRVREKSAAAQRLTVDVVEVARALREAAGPAGAEEGRQLREERPRLVEALSAAAGVPEVVAAVEGSWRHRGSLATGW
uniref:GTPase n=1 Tax=Desertihabitans aurantiacus TaxID=2282477 RepID=UPI0018E58190